MYKVLINSFLILFWTIICLCIGYVFAKNNIEPITITKHETVWKDKVVYRDYLSIPKEDLIEDLKCYDQSEFKLNIENIRESEYKITGNLCERGAYKVVNIECGESGDYKLYLGIGLAAAVVAGIYIGVK